MDIWTEQLERRHLLILAHWVGRSSGAMTPNDLPTKTEDIPHWYEKCSIEPGRMDCLILVYDTPVGLAGLRQLDSREGVAELYLQLYEVNYNLLRTATYATLRMLDRAFQARDIKRVEARVHAQYREYLEALDRMGFSRTTADNQWIYVGVEKDIFLSRKYLF